MKLSIGFIGLGSMGFPMARNLIKSGFPVTLYNRTRERAEPLLKEGAKWADSPAELLAESQVVISIVSDDNALRELVYGKGGLGEGLKPGTIHLSMSTISPAISRELHSFHLEKGAEYVVGTVSGRPEGAAAQTLWIFLAGEEKAKAVLDPILKVLGQKVFDVGEKPEFGNLVKLSGNFLIISAIEAIAEATRFAEAQGLDRSVIGSVFAESIFACPIFKIYAPIIAEKCFTPAGFKLALGLKDIRLFMEEAKKCGSPLPLAHLVHQQLESSLEKGRGEMDWAAITLEL